MWTLPAPPDSRCPRSRSMPSAAGGCSQQTDVSAGDRPCRYRARRADSRQLQPFAATVPSILAFACTVLVFASLSGCSRRRTADTGGAALAIPAFDLIVRADRYTGTPGTTFTLTAVSATGREPIIYEWQLADGLRSSGATARVTLNAVGTFVSTVTATDATNKKVEAQMASTVFPAAGAPTKGLLGVPRLALPGDLDGTGRITLEDALRCARVAARRCPSPTRSK